MNNATPWLKRCGMPHLLKRRQWHFRWSSIPRWSPWTTSSYHQEFERIQDWRRQAKSKKKHLGKMTNKRLSSKATRTGNGAARTIEENVRSVKPMSQKVQGLGNVHNWWQTKEKLNSIRKEKDSQRKKRSLRHTLARLSTLLIRMMQWRMKTVIEEEGGLAL